MLVVFHGTQKLVLTVYNLLQGQLNFLLLAFLTSPYLHQNKAVYTAIIILYFKSFRASE